MLQLSEFYGRFFNMSRFLNNFLLLDATDRSKINSNQKCLFFFAKSRYPLHFSRTLPLNARLPFPFIIVPLYISEKRKDGTKRITYILPDLTNQTVESIIYTHPCLSRGFYQRNSIVSK